MGTVLEGRLHTFGLIVASVALIGYLAATASAGFTDVLAAVDRVGAAGVAIALALSLVNYAVRFLRWEAYLHTLGHRLPRVASFRIYLAGFAWTVTPAKAGEALRSFLLERLGVPVRASVAALLSERASDLAAVVVLSLVGVALYPQSETTLVLIGVGATMLAWLLLAASAPAGLARRAEAALSGPLQRAAAHVAATLEASRRCHRAGLAALALALGVIAWAAEAAALYLVLGWMGAEVSLPLAVLAYALAMLAGALSFVPGGLGSAEAVMIGVLLWQQVPFDIAVAATLLIRLTTLWFAVVLGIGALASFARPRAG